jgi:hypothetical protein
MTGRDRRMGKSYIMKKVLIYILGQVRQFGSLIRQNEMGGS